MDVFRPLYCCLNPNNEGLSGCLVNVRFWVYILLVFLASLFEIESSVASVYEFSAGGWDAVEGTCRHSILRISYGKLDILLHLLVASLMVPFLTVCSKRAVMCHDV